MEIELLGKVAVVVDGHEIDAGPDRQRCVLVALAVDVGQVVPVDRLIERVWGERPPSRARSTMLSYLSRLRQTLDVGGTSVVVRRAGGYALTVGPAAVDLHVFRDLCAQARVAAGDPQRQATLLEQALGLWRGEALTGLGGEWAAEERDRLHSERDAAEDDLTDASLLLGHGESLVPRLAVRTAAVPLDERVAGQHIRALHRAGRTADALAHYRRVQARLAEELGTDPGHALRELHQQVLNDDPDLVGKPASAQRLAGPRLAVPRQLPPAPASFVGRQRAVDLLDSMLAGPPENTVVISAVSGVGGIGKTTLALHWAYSHPDRFPDGQLFVDLRGFSPDDEPMEPAVAVRGFLDALGVDPNGVPSAPHAQAALYRSLLADKQMLVVLDNAAGSDQVLPLLPSGVNCVVVITSRHRLTGLITHHAVNHIPLDALSDSESAALLTDRLHAERITAEPAAAQDLIDFCGGYSLALSIVAGLATTRPDSRLADLATELRTLGLTTLDNAEPSASLPTVLSWSLRHLTDDQLRLFALLGISPGPDISLAAASRLAGTPEHTTYPMLRALADASLIDRTRDGRYRMLDLVRAYAVRRALALPAETQEPALRRVIDFYSSTAHAAELLLGTQYDDLRPTPPTSSATPHPLADPSEALAWQENECACALAAQRTAMAHNWHEAAWHLAWNLNFTFTRRRRNAEQIVMWQLATESASHLDNPVFRLLSLQFLGFAHAENRDAEAALPVLETALGIAEHHPDRNYLARTHVAFTITLEHQGDLSKALEHGLKALHLFQDLGQPVREANAHNTLAWIAARMEEYGTARHRAEAALALYRRHPKVDGEAATLDTLGYIDHKTGNYASAITHYRRSIALLFDCGNESLAAEGLGHLGDSHAALGQTEEAARAWSESLRLYEEQGQEQHAGPVRERLAALADRQSGR